MLPADDHVHSEWSWDAPGGSMERTCARASALGLPSVAFTEHAEFTPRHLPPGGGVPEGFRCAITTDGVLIAPELDLDGYLDCIERCRHRFPDLRIRSGVELSEPHWHGDRTARLLDLAGFDRILGSMHSARTADGRTVEVGDAFREQPAGDVVREYLAETTRMIETSDAFAVLAHVDYPLRAWPADAGPHDVHPFEDDYRGVLRALAGTGRALEVNTRVPLPAQIVRWWRAEGGEAVTFGSDAHEPALLARGLADAAQLVQACGFRPGRDPYDFWTQA